MGVKAAFPHQCKHRLAQRFCTALVGVGLEIIKHVGNELDGCVAIDGHIPALARGVFLPPECADFVDLVDCDCRQIVIPFCRGIRVPLPQGSAAGYNGA